MLTDIYTGRHTERYADRHSDRQADIQPEKQIDRAKLMLITNRNIFLHLLRALFALKN